MDRAPTAHELLSVWEQGLPQAQVPRAFSLLALALPTASAEDLAGFGIGRRDRELFALRRRIFGPHMTGTAQCPSCSQKVELDFSVDDIREPLLPDDHQPQTIQLGGYEVQFRLPTCGDLVALEPSSDLSGSRSALLQRCVTEARLNGEAIAASSLPGTVTQALSQRMAELDPQGDTRLSLNCPTCAQSWRAPIDIVSYLWTEIHAWAERMLRDVHTLAAAYGWREADILAMGPRRRQAYLEIIRQ